MRENEITARKKKSKISLLKRFRYDKIKKRKNNQEAVFFTSKKIEKVPAAREEILRP